jgi:hypothetical protein
MKAAISNTYDILNVFACNALVNMPTLGHENNFVGACGV